MYIRITYTSPEENEEDICLTISRDELNVVIRDRFEDTLSILEVILDRNNLTSEDIQEIIMIGGSTYIPYIRKSIATRINIKVNTNADLTTAIVVGAAYFAGNKPITTKKTTIIQEENVDKITIQTGYNTTTKDSEEYITASVTNFRDGLNYRITRADGGFDSGIKKLTPKFGEFVLLLPSRLNNFQIKIFDEKNNLIEVIVDDIQTL